MIKNINLDQLISLRHKLHRHAELSNHEQETASIIKDFINGFKPDTLFEGIGGHGLIFKFTGSDQTALNIGFRADMDALPIDETIKLPYASKTAGVSHKCGHDGHSVMVAGLAKFLSHRQTLKNTIYLIFQPAEETGEGAKAISTFLKSKGIKLDYLFGLHNLPGFKLGEVICRKGTFAAASTGMVITLRGQTSHAGEPENGISPAIAFANIITDLTNLSAQHDVFEKLVLLTVVQASLGEIAFGITPGYAEIRVTLRAIKDNDLEKLKLLAEEMVYHQAGMNELLCEVHYTESFPSTENKEEILNVMQKSAHAVALDFSLIETPFRWSEDFGHYKKITTSGFFGLGAGMDCATLHNEAYNFPDQIIKDGLNMYIGLIEHFEKHTDHKSD